jgi:hypothetical protein
MTATIPLILNKRYWSCWPVSAQRLLSIAGVSGAWVGERYWQPGSDARTEVYDILTAYPASG